MSAEACELVYSGLDYGVFNIALLDRPVASERDLAAILRTIAGRFYRERKVALVLLDVRGSVWSRRRAATAAKFSPRPACASISHAPGMVAPALTAPPSRLLPRIECRAVTDAASRAAFAGLTVTCFDIPMAVARAVYEPEAAWEGAYRASWAWSTASPVSIVALVRAAGAVGVYSLGTVPAYRHKGYGEALLRAAVVDGERRRR